MQQNEEYLLQRDPDVSEESIVSLIKIEAAETDAKLSLLLTGVFLGLLFDPGDGGNIFVRIVRLSPNYMALQLRAVILNICETAAQ
jgi:hypothetical protein